MRKNQGNNRRSFKRMVVCAYLALLTYSALANALDTSLFIPDSISKVIVRYRFDAPAHVDLKLRGVKYDIADVISPSGEIRYCASLPYWRKLLKACKYQDRDVFLGDACGEYQVHEISADIAIREGDKSRLFRLYIGQAGRECYMIMDGKPGTTIIVYIPEDIHKDVNDEISKQVNAAIIRQQEWFNSNVKKGCD